MSDSRLMRRVLTAAAYGRAVPAPSAARKYISSYVDQGFRFPPVFPTRARSAQPPSHALQVNTRVARSRWQARVAALDATPQKYASRHRRRRWAELSQRRSLHSSAAVPRANPSGPEPERPNSLSGIIAAVPSATRIHRVAPYFTNDRDGSVRRVFPLGLERLDPAAGDPEGVPRKKRTKATRQASAKAEIAQAAVGPLPPHVYGLADGLLCHQNLAEAEYYFSLLRLDQPVPAGSWVEVRIDGHVKEGVLLRYADRDTRQFTLYSFGEVSECRTSDIMFWIPGVIPEGNLRCDESPALSYPVNHRTHDLTSLVQDSIQRVAKWDLVTLYDRIPAGTVSVTLPELVLLARETIMNPVIDLDPHVLLFVFHKLTMDDALHFIADSVTYRQTLQYTVRSREEVKMIQTVTSWDRTKHANVLSFARKCAEYRLKKAEPQTQDEARISWTENDRLILSFLQHSLAVERETQKNVFAPIVASLLKKVDAATELAYISRKDKGWVAYKLKDSPPELMRLVGTSSVALNSLTARLLAEVDVIEPWTDIALAYIQPNLERWNVAERGSEGGSVALSDGAKQGDGATEGTASAPQTKLDLHQHAIPSTVKDTETALATVYDHKPQLVKERFITLRSQKKSKIRSLTIPGREAYEAIPNNAASLLPRDQLTLDVHERVREDYTQENVYVIDEATADELDDGVSISAAADGKVWVRVHIADPTQALHKHHNLTAAAFDHFNTLYLPEKTHAMLPSALIDAQRFSLDAVHRGSNTAPVNVFTISLLLDDKGVLHDSRVAVARVQRVTCVTYDRVNELLNYSDTSSDPEPLYSAPPGDFVPPAPEITRTLHNDALPAAAAADIARLSAIAQRLYANRVASGALMWRAPKAKISHYGPQGSRAPLVALSGDTQRELTSPANVLVSEFMIAANRALAEFAHSAGIAIAFRGQRPSPSLLKDVTELRARRDTQGEIAFQDFIRADFVMESGEGLEPRAHHVMGIDSPGKKDAFGHFNGYTRGTSPLRRVTDMVVHYQVKKALLPPDEQGLWRAYSAVEVPALMRTLAHAEKSIGRASLYANTFWAAYVLQQNRTRLPAYDATLLNKAFFSANLQAYMAPVILNELGVRCQLIVSDPAKLASVLDDLSASRGETVSVVVKDVILSTRPRVVVDLA